MGNYEVGREESRNNAMGNLAYTLCDAFTKRGSGGKKYLVYILQKNQVFKDFPGSNYFGL